MENMVVVNTAKYFILVLNSEDIFKIGIIGSMWDFEETLSGHYQDSTYRG